MCKIHTSEHLVFKGNHEITELLCKPDDEESEEISRNFFDVLTKIRKIKAQTLENTKAIIEQAIQKINKLIGYLEQLENRFTNMYTKLLSYKEIIIQDVESFMNLANCDENYIFNDICTELNNLTNFYDIDLCTGAVQALFLDGSSGFELFVKSQKSYFMPTKFER